MKRLLSIVIIIGIIAYIAVQYFKDRRFNPPSSYDYVISEQIDTDYHDPLVVKEYYKTALEIGSFARSLWNNDKIDVRFMESGNLESQEATAYYNQLIVTAKWLEDKLEKSKEFSAQGYSKREIALLEQGKSPSDLRLNNKMYLLGLQRGSSGAEVWELQKLLNTTGDSIPEDGLYNQMTVNRVRNFQRRYNLFPSGNIDKNTLKALLK